MRPAPLHSPALAGGYELDPDLPPPEDDVGLLGELAGLHVLRHLDRFLRSLRMELVLARHPYDTFEWHISGEYDEETCTRELRRYRTASPSTLRRLLRDEPHRVPLLHASGTSCIGWSSLSFEGVRLDQYLRQGQLFAYFPSYAHMLARANKGRFLHLLAWQEPFPTHSLVSWTNGAALCRGPQPLAPEIQDAAARMFRTGRPAQRGSRSQARV